jgi:hypothetical protein
MNISTLFTNEEKKSFLIKNGYELVEYNHDVWEQWGNHDSQGSWIKIDYVCAVKDGESPSTQNIYTEVFQKIIITKFKEFLINS